MRYKIEQTIVRSVKRMGIKYLKDVLRGDHTVCQRPSRESKEKKRDGNKDKDNLEENESFQRR